MSNEVVRKIEFVIGMVCILLAAIDLVLFLSNNTEAFNIVFNIVFIGFMTLVATCIYGMLGNYIYKLKYNGHFYLHILAIFAAIVVIFAICYYICFKYDINRLCFVSILQFAMIALIINSTQTEND